MRLVPPLMLVLALSCSTAIAQDADDILLHDAAQRSVAVAAVLDMPLQSPAERMRAVFTLLDLGELDVARVLLKPIMEANLNDQAKADLVAQFGTARFLNLARRDEPVAAGENSPLAGAREFAEKCLASAAKVARDPQRIGKLVTNLNDPSAEVRNAARVDLAVTGTAGAQACFEMLAKTADEAHRGNLLHALAGLRPEMDPLLLAVLADGEGRVLRDAAELAGHVGMLDAAPLLAATAAGSPNPAVRNAAQKALTRLGLTHADLGEARSLLLGEIRRLEAGVPSTLAAGGDSPWWIFSQANGTFTSQDVPQQSRQLLTIARLAGALGRLPQATPQDEQTALLYAYQSARALGRPLPPDLEILANSFTTTELSSVLARALKHNQIAAALACVELLGNRRDITALSSLDARPAPLAQALRHPDPQLRFAALEAVMNISPQRSFPGSSAVAPALWRFADGGGQPQAIAASSLATQSSNWAGQLRGLGYDATPAATGREALEAAIGAPRLAFVIVDSDISRPPLREVLYQLRVNTATTGAPIAILSSTQGLDRAQQLAIKDPRLLAEVRPHSVEEMEAIVGKLTAMPFSLGDAAERQARAVQALTWLAEIVETGHPYDELLRDAGIASEHLQDAALLEPSLRLLAVLDTAGSQKALVDFASNPSTSLEARQKAAEAFAANVQRNGKLLMPSEITAQFDRYNMSESADRGTQKVLGYLLDVLESKPLQPLQP